MNTNGVGAVLCVASDRHRWCVGQLRQLNKDARHMEGALAGSASWERWQGTLARSQRMSMTEKLHVVSERRREREREREREISNV